MPLRFFVSSTLRKHIPLYEPSKGLELDAGEGTTVAEVCKRINIPPGEVKIVMVNGRNEAIGYLLKGDERVALFPPVGGG